MTPFRKRPHLRIAGFGDATDGEAVPADPNAPPQAPPAPRSVTAQPGDVVPELNGPDPTPKDFVSGAKDMVIQGLFVGIGSGFASEVLKWIFDRPQHRSSGLSGVRHRRPKKKLQAG
jgi:hypothetical protein